MTDEMFVGKVSRSYLVFLYCCIIYETFLLCNDKAEPVLFAVQYTGYPAYLYFFASGNAFSSCIKRLAIFLLPNHRERT